MSANRHHLPIVLACVVFLSGLSDASGAVREEKTLNGKRLGITVALDPAEGFHLTGLVDEQTGYRFAADESLLWQANLRNPDQPEATPLGLSAPSGRAGFRGGDFRWGTCDSRSLELIYANILVPGSPHQRLSARIVLRLREADDQLVSTLAAELSGEGPLLIHDLKFPLLSLGPIGDDPGDDQLILPAWGGLYVPDPIHTGNSRDDERPRMGDVPRNSLTYPGYVESQFMAYCDPVDADDGRRVGLWLACEDTAGNTKRLMFQGDEEANALHIFFRHFNTAPAGLPDQKAVIDALQEFAIHDKLGYEVAWDTFTGDWVDASNLYRQWMERAQPPFLSKGTLRERTDMPQDVKENIAVLGYMPDQTPRTAITSDLDDSRSDLSKIKRMLEFVTFDGRYDWDVDIGFGGGTKRNPNQEGRYKGVGGDAFFPPLHREGMHELLRGIQDLGVASVAFNRDIGNWAMNRNPALDAQAQTKGYVINFDGRHFGQPRDDFSVSCGGSRWIAESRVPNILAFVEASRVDGEHGYTDGILSGKGPGALLCWAALHPDRADMDAHDHPVGGGSYWVDALRTLAERLQHELGPLYWPMGERGHEHQVDWSRLGGRHRYWPWDTTFPGVAGQWIEGAQPVPIRAYLFHHYCPLSTMGIPRSVMLKVYRPDLHVDRARPEQLESARWRFRTAEMLLVGERMGLFVAAGGPVARDLDVVLDGTIDDVLPPVRADLEFFRNLVRLRSNAKDLLVYGRMQRPPVIDCGSRPMRFQGSRRGRSVWYEEQIPHVLGTAWSDGETFGCVFVNHTDAEQRFRFAFDPTEVGLEDFTAYEWMTAGDDGWQPAPGLSIRDRDTGKWSSNELRLPAQDGIAILARPMASEK